ncbi:MAG: thioesterase [Treponema sp.]|nr:thioesterase [Treponema sp.]
MNEITYKQWHDSDFTFYKQIKLSFSQCDATYKMSWNEILRFTSDNAGEDFSMRNMDWPFLQSKGIVLIVSRISFHVCKMPVADQLITLKTWESAAMGPLCTRNYEIFDSVTNEPLIKGQSLWTILDLNNKKIIPAKNYTYRPIPVNTVNFEGLKCGKIPAPETMESLGSRKIVFSDLDSNGHTNNAKYINFAIDALPEEFQRKQIKDMRLNYSKEAMLGQILELKGHYDSEAGKYTVFGCVDGSSSFECELYY